MSTARVEPRLGPWIRALARAGALAFAVAMGAPGCGSFAPPPPPPIPTPTPIPPIRVGLTEDSPPFAFRQSGHLVGIEVDLAGYFARELGRPLRVYPMAFDELIPALLNREIDVIMSGMTVTRLREVRVAFSEPYLRSGLAVLIRRGEARQYKTPEAALKGSLRIGVTKATLGEKYVREHAAESQVLSYTTNTSAIAELEARRIDAFAGDVPVVAWYASANEGTLEPLMRPLLTHDSIAWGFRPTADTLRDKADAALARWKEDGTLSGVLLRWLPRWEPAEETRPRPRRSAR